MCMHVQTEEGRGEGTMRGGRGEAEVGHEGRNEGDDRGSERRKEGGKEDRRERDSGDANFKVHKYFDLHTE